MTATRDTCQDQLARAVRDLLTEASTGDVPSDLTIKAAQMALLRYYDEQRARDEAEIDARRLADLFHRVAEGECPEGTMLCADCQTIIFPDESLPEPKRSEELKAAYTVHRSECGGAE